jgi:beta-galactosidase
MRCGLAGPFAAGGTVVLTASRTDWSLFNRKSEEEKMGSICCYEKLIKPSGAALVARKVGAGTVAVCTIDTTVDTPARRAFWTRLFAHMGVKAQPAQAAGRQGVKKAHDLLLDGPQK